MERITSAIGFALTTKQDTIETGVGTPNYASKLADGDEPG